LQAGTPVAEPLVEVPMTRLVIAIAIACAACAAEQPSAETTTNAENAPLWRDCAVECDTVVATITGLQFRLLSVLRSDIPTWTGNCAADDACRGAVTTIAGLVTSANEQLRQARKLLKSVQTSMTDIVIRAELDGIGQPGVQRLAKLAFLADLALTIVRVSTDLARATQLHLGAVNDLGGAEAAAQPFTEIRDSVHATLAPITTAILANMVGPLLAYKGCVVTELARMNAVAAQGIALGFGPFGGFNPPNPGPNIAAFVRPDPSSADPYGPVFGPTMAWLGDMPMLTFDFSEPPYDGPAHAMKTCVGPGDACDPLAAEPMCPAAIAGGPDCQIWRSAVQFWVTYQLPAGTATTPLVESAMENACATSPDGTFCPAWDGAWGNCQHGTCVIVPEGTSLCAGVRGYGPFPAEVEVTYSCSADYSLCPPESCLLVATQNAAFQYTLVPPDAPPEAIECSRQMHDGSLSNAVLYPGDTIGCRVTLRTDGPPEDAGLVQSKKLVITHVDVKEAWGDATALHVEQPILVKWRSQVPPTTCYAWSSYDQTWRYDASLCE
jgi:hypothetical protein